MAETSNPQISETARVKNGFSEGSPMRAHIGFLDGNFRSTSILHILIIS